MATPVELCYTATQIRNTKICIAAIVGISFFQSYTIARMNKDLTHGREQFNKLHGASMYLFEILERNNVELSEFDEIALTELTAQRK